MNLLICYPKRAMCLCILYYAGADGSQIHMCMQTYKRNQTVQSCFCFCICPTLRKRKPSLLSLIFDLLGFCRRTYITTRGDGLLPILAGFCSASSAEFSERNFLIHQRRLLPQVGEGGNYRVYAYMYVHNLEACIFGMLCAFVITSSQRCFHKLGVTWNKSA